MKNDIAILKKIIPFFNGCKKNIIFLIVVNLLMILISVFTPKLLSKIIACVLELNYKKVLILIIILCSLKLFSLLFSVINLKNFYKIRIKFVLALKNKISSAILNFDIATFSLNGKGKFLQRINNDPENIGNLMSILNNYLVYLLSNFGVLILLLFVNVYIGIVYLSFTFLVLYIRNIGIRKRLKYKSRVLETQENINDDFSELLNGFKDIKQLNMKDKFKNKSVEQFDKLESLNMSADFTYVFYDKIAYAVEALATLIVLFLGMYFYNNGNLLTDELLSIFLYRSYVFSFSDNLTNFLFKFSEFTLSCKRMLEVIDLDNKSNCDECLDECNGSIEFKNVNFSYDNNNVLKNCSFKIKNNDKVLIVGDSGSGKTTILNLISKIYNVIDGEILIDNKNINDLSELFIRKNITVISQFYYLFDMSIIENFLLVKPDASMEEIYNVCKKVGIYDFIMSLPDKYDTRIGSGGYNLSGGQRQRIALARTLLLDSKIILFDEATSSLDASLDNLIMELIRDLEKKHTIIFVSHNTNHFKDFSKILVLNNGTIENYGSHKYLLSNSKKYKELYYGNK